MRLSLRTKIFSAFMAFSLLFLLASVNGYINAGRLEKIAKRNTDLFNEYRTVSELDRRAKEEVPLLLRYATDENRRQQLKRDFFHSRLRFNQKLFKLKSFNLLEDKEKELLAKISREDKIIERRSTTLFKLPPGSQKTDAVINKMEKDINRLAEDLDEYRDLDKYEIYEGISRIDKIKQTEKGLAFAVIIIVLLLLIAAHFAARYITAPLYTLHQEVRQIKRGHLGRHISINTGDEIEELAEAFNEMIDNLNADEQTAARLQQRLLPPKKIRVKGINLHAQQTQAKIVGGDWYDYYHQNNSIFFLIADASGKGMSGALLATLAMSSIRSEAKKDTDISQILINTNQTIERRLGAGNFVTLFHGRLDLDTNILYYINCGHELPLIYRVETNAWMLLPCRSNLPLGISTGHFHPRREKLKLEKGDKIIFYTDGLHDIRDAERRFFNIDMIIDWLNNNRYPIDITIDKLLEYAMEFCHGEAADDITLLGLEIAAVPAALRQKSRQPSAKLP